MCDICQKFFPENYNIEKITENAHGYIFRLISTSQNGICPECKSESNRQHSIQERTARDLPILGKRVTLQIVQNKYFCDKEDCTTRIFTERSDFIKEGAQFTNRCKEYMLYVATQVSCEAAVKILAYQGIRVSGDTLLIMLKEAGAAYKSTVGTKIGVDDWAYRRGQTYGTIICDLETHDIVDILEGRDSETFEKWLRGHPDIEIVSRDRASAYASAVKNTLPNAIQIADRFHITQNLLDALNETMKSFLPEVIEVPNSEDITESKETEVNNKREVNLGVKKTLRRRNGEFRK